MLDDPESLRRGAARSGWPRMSPLPTGASRAVAPASTYATAHHKLCCTKRLRAAGAHLELDDGRPAGELLLDRVGHRLRLLRRRPRDLEDLVQQVHCGAEGCVASMRTWTAAKSPRWVGGAAWPEEVAGMWDRTRRVLPWCACCPCAPMHTRTATVHPRLLLQQELWLCGPAGRVARGARARPCGMSTLRRPLTAVPGAPQQPHLVPDHPWACMRSRSSADAGTSRPAWPFFTLSTRSHETRPLRLLVSNLMRLFKLCGRVLPHEGRAKALAASLQQQRAWGTRERVNTPERIVEGQVACSGRSPHVCGAARERETSAHPNRLESAGLWPGHYVANRLTPMLRSPYRL